MHTKGTGLELAQTIEKTANGPYWPRNEKILQRFLLEMGRGGVVVSVLVGGPVPAIVLFP